METMTKENLLAAIDNSTALFVWFGLGESGGEYIRPLSSYDIRLAIEAQPEGSEFNAKVGPGRVLYIN
jgi:hypothetical protein